MQTQVERARHRGYRLSRFLVGLGHQATMDVATIVQNELDSTDYHTANIPTNLQTIMTTQVSALQHQRCQLRYRLRVTS